MNIKAFNEAESYKINIKHLSIIFLDPSAAHIEYNKSDRQKSRQIAWTPCCFYSLNTFAESSQQPEFRPVHTHSSQIEISTGVHTNLCL